MGRDLPALRIGGRDHRHRDQRAALPGQFRDAETSLHYNYFRDYDPAIGRYIQSDPIGLGGGLNTYAYVGGKPTKFADPTGEFAPPVSGCIAGAWAGPVGCGVGATVTTGLALAFGAATLLSPDSPSDGAKDEADPDDCCEPLYRDIDRQVGIVKQRYSDMRRDDGDFYNDRPTGRMSWASHQQQYRQDQKILRDLLNEADAKGCKNYRPDAWK